MRPATLKAIRLTHLYSGVFLAPAILFFAITGGLQMFSFHEASHAPGYVPPAILVSLSRLHKKATLSGPPPPPAKPAPRQTPTPPPSLPKPPAKPGWSEHLPMKIFFAIVAVGLVISTLTGLIMSFKYTRRKIIPSLVLLAGVAVPALLLLISR